MPFHRILAAMLPSLGILAATALPVAPAAAALVAQPAGDDAKSLPGASELFDRYIEALGGESAIRAIKSRTVEGSIVPKGAESNASQITIRQIAPDRLLAVVKPAQGPVQERGYDGVKGWRRSGTSPAEEVTGEALTQLKATADIYQEANYKQRYKELQTARLTEFAGKPAYEVKAVDTQGKTSFIYFSPNDHLLMGHRQEQPTQAGTTNITMTLGDYKQFGGVLHATKIVQGADGREVTITYSNIRVNAADVAPIDAPAELVTKK